MRSGGRGSATEMARADVRQEAPLRDQGRAAAVSVKSALLVVPGLSVVTFLSLPLLAILLKVVPQAGLWETLREPLVTQALRLSLITSLSSLLLALLFGTPVAYLLARYRFRGARVVETLIDLPMVLPPTVAGVALLMAFGRRGLLGPWLTVAGLQIGFSTTAVILAQSFVSLPFYVRAAQAGFRSVDPELERVAYTLGVSPLRTFWRVTVPLALPALLSGGVMAWARALGEFGATIMFAGNLRGRTQTMPLAIYLAMESDLPAALALSTLLIVVSFSVLLSVRALVRRGVLDTYA
jgi:molybdate transport system permease protein